MGVAYKGQGKHIVLNVMELSMGYVEEREKLAWASSRSKIHCVAEMVKGQRS